MVTQHMYLFTNYLQVAKYHKTVANKGLLRGCDMAAEGVCYRTFVCSIYHTNLYISTNLLVS